MSIIMKRPFRFADKVLVDNKKGTVIGVTDLEITVQFVKGKVSLKWEDLKENPKLIKHA